MHQLQVSNSVEVNAPKKDGDGIVTPSGTQLAGVVAPHSKQQNIMRPKEYDGKEPVNSYLAHFRVCAEFNKWSEDEKRSWLQWSLKDRARQALWDEPNCTTMSFTELEKALRSRFGSEHQREIHKMELENRKRRSHESLSDLMQDIRRLMVLGYGNEQGPMWESVAIKSFLSSLDDPHLAIDIRKQRPATLDAAYLEALLLDGYYRTTPGERGDGDKGRKRDQTRLARVDEEKSMHERNWQREMLQAQKSTTAEVQQMLSNMQRQLDEQRQLLGLTMSAPHAGDRQEHRNMGEFRHTFEVPVSGDREAQQPADTLSYSRPRGRCYRCNGAGHFARNCPGLNPPEEGATGTPYGATVNRRVAADSSARTAAVTAEGRLPGDGLGAYPSTDTLRESQLQDPEIRQVMEFKQSSEDAPPAEARASLSPAVKVYLTYWPLLEIKDGILYRRKSTADVASSNLQIVVPKKLRPNFLRLAHSGFGGGHLGSRRTARAVQARACWVGWGADTRRFCGLCEVCAKYHRGAAPKRGPLQEMTAGGPWERLGVDITGPHRKSSRGHIYRRVVADAQISMTLHHSSVWGGLSNLRMAKESHQEESPAGGAEVVQRPDTRDEA